MSSIDDYLAAQPADTQAVFAALRATVHRLVPDAKEAWSYGMPAFRYRQRYLLGFSAFTHHLSVFPGAAPVAQLADQLSGFTTSKGTIQFTAEHQLPTEVLERVILAAKAVIDNRVK